MPRARAPLDLGGNKLTSVANGTGSGDGAAFGQLPSASSPLATGSGGTGSATVAGAVYAAKPATTDAVCYVSKAASASDANDGLSLGSAKATLAAAVTALGSGPGVIRMGAGTWTITSPAAVNIPLAVEGIPGATVISTSTANTPVFAVTANNVTLTGLTLTGPQFAAFRSSEKAVTVLGSSASAPVTGFTMRDCVISNWGYGGLYLQYVSGFTVERCTVTNVLYAAVMVLSGAEGMIRGNLIDTVTGTGEPDCYGIALTRNDAVGTTLTTDPRTTEVTVTGNRVRNVTTWEGIDTHGGTNLDITGNQVYGCYRGIAINNCPDATGAAAFAPHNVSVSGNIVDSTALGAGLADVGIVVQGAITTAGSPTECATGCTITGNTVTGCGLQGNNLSGAILGVATYGLQVTGNTIHQPSPFGVMLYHDNYGFTVSGNTVTDAWSSSYTLTSGVAVRSGWNTGHIGSNSYVRPGSLSATFLFVNGTYITSGITNSSVALGYGYCDPAIATPLSDVSAVSKPLPVASGGTGTATAAQNGVFAGPATGGTGAPSFRALATTDVPTLNQNTTGTAANLSGTPALPSGTTAATQTTGDSSTKIATDAFVATAVAGETTRAQGAELVTANRTAGIFSPLNYGAVGNGTTDDTTAVQAAFAAATAVQGVVDLGTRIYKTSSPVTLSAFVTVRGASTNTQNGTSGGIITNSASDVFTLASAVVGVLIENCGIRASAGHVFNAGSSSVSSFNVDGVWISQSAPGKAIWYQTGGVYVGNSWGARKVSVLTCPASATQSPFYINCTTINNNYWGMMRAQGQGASVPFFSIIKSTAGWTEENTFDQIIFEVCNGGAIAMVSATDVQVNQCSNWDITAAAGHGYSFTGNSGYPCASITITNGLGAEIGTEYPTSGYYDLYCAAGTLNAVLINWGGGVGAAPLISAPAGQLTIIGGQNNSGSPLVSVPGLTVTPPVNATGANGPTRYLPGTSGGAPSAGTYQAGDVVPDSTGAMWICTAAPHTFAAVGSAYAPVRI